MKLRNLIVQTLKEEVVPAMGCTEPVAVALACAKAKELITFNYIEKAEVFVSPNIYKNGLSVGIPNTQEVGLYIAAALGFIGGESEKDLRVLEGINEEQVKLSKECKIVKAVLERPGEKETVTQIPLDSIKAGSEIGIIFKSDLLKI